MIRYEREENPIRLDFAPIKTDSDLSNVNNRRGSMMSSHHLEVYSSISTVASAPSRLVQIAAKKAHLVVRMVDDFIGREIMMQVTHVIGELRRTGMSVCSDSEQINVLGDDVVSQRCTAQLSFTFAHLQ